MHAKMTTEVISSGKSVFMEKPLALNENDWMKLLKIIIQKM